MRMGVCAGAGSGSETSTTPARAAETARLRHLVVMRFLLRGQDRAERPKWVFLLANIPEGVKVRPRKTLDGGGASVNHAVSCERTFRPYIIRTSGTWRCPTLPRC